MGDYTNAELMAAAIACELTDDDFAAVGTASHIPVCALRLAQRTHAPNLWFLYGGSGALTDANGMTALGQCYSALARGGRCD